MARRLGQFLDRSHDRWHWILGVRFQDKPEGNVHRDIGLKFGLRARIFCPKKSANVRLPTPAGSASSPNSMQRLKIGILGSGKGSNFRAILTEIQSGRLDADPVAVLADAESAGILNLAREAGIPAHVINEPRYRTRLSPEVEEDVVRILQAAGVELVVLAGYMRMVKPPLLEAFPRRVINIHPALLPKFPGLESWRQALEAGEATSGCTVHFVDGGMDTGAIIAQAEVPVLPGDTAASLHARIQVAEHVLYPEVIRRFAARELP